MYDEEDSIHPPVYTNDHKDENKLVQEKEKEALINEIQLILNAGHSVDNEKSLLNIVQKQRKLILDIATTTFLNKPNNPKLMDSINTLLGQMEKSVRDDRKERLRDRELEDNKASFATFVNALNEVSAGRLVMPTFAEFQMPLDPFAEHKLFKTDNPDEEISEEEKFQGRQILDSKKIEEAFEIDPEQRINTSEKMPEDFDAENS
ncbi:hypothetical protein AH04_256 [Erwinia phage AH04]|uniref:Uncharacterized protein n=1 Tax=Erwinia phage AH04 TaxID=2869569 RepID=A0AAE7X0T6_9CAUD|nr:hypothetical protein PQC02_gp058 [Erwinia phage AH04]QZA70729.1 hypothetical protein AH04_256 [Erwinia phage AH04]